MKYCSIGQHVFCKPTEEHPFPRNGTIVAVSLSLAYVEDDQDGRIRAFEDKNISLVHNEINVS